ncbi:MAG: hypothetical protein J5783_03385 [Lachnospiraceae bacterium]|nr:hypothetical protein [Lachnospiraceae bacterium]
MKRRAYKIVFFNILLLCLTLFGSLFTEKTYAKDLDVIHEYDITADFTTSGKVRLRYRLDWEVLDHKTEGPLTWIKVGIPNSHVSDIKGLSDNIRIIGYYNENGYFIRVDLDRAYKKGERLVIEFEMLQDNLFEEINNASGECVIGFTPGWFPDTVVEKMVLKWSGKDVKSCEPEGVIEDDGYITWQKDLAKNEKYTIRVVYPDSTAISPVLDFSKVNNVLNSYNDISRQIEEDMNRKILDDYNKRNKGGYSGNYKPNTVVLILVIVGIVAVAAFIIIIAVIRARYIRNGSGYYRVKNKIIWTKIIFHTLCPNCGAPRMPDRYNCIYCGASMIKSEEKLEKEEIKSIKKQLKKEGLWEELNRDGICAFGHLTNVYIEISHVSYTMPKADLPDINTGGGGSKIGKVISIIGDIVSKCACACAGGGRAGCSTKDFYNTGLKLRQLELKKKYQKKCRSALSEES